MQLSVSNIISVKKYAALRLVCCITAVITLALMSVMPLFVINGKFVYPLYDFIKAIIGFVEYVFQGHEIEPFNFIVVAYLLLLFGITATLVANIVKCVRVLSDNEKETEAFVLYCKSGMKKYRKSFTNAEINSNLLYPVIGMYVITFLAYSLNFYSPVPSFFNLPILLLLAAYVVLLIMKHVAKHTVSKMATLPESGKEGNPFN